MWIWDHYSSYLIILLYGNLKLWRIFSVTSYIVSVISLLLPKSCMYSCKMVELSFAITRNLFWADLQMCSLVDTAKWSYIDINWYNRNIDVSRLYALCRTEQFITTHYYYNVWVGSYKIIEASFGLNRSHRPWQQHLMLNTNYIH